MLAMKQHGPAMRGFTLIELMVVLAMIVVLASIAAPNFQRSIARQKTSVAASELLTSVLQARSAAITNNQVTYVQPLVSTDWSRGWRIYIDVDKDKTFTAGTDTPIATVAAMDENVLQNEVALNAVVGNLIGFDANGYLVGRNAGRVVFGSALIPAGELRKGVKVSVTGRARICTSTTNDNGCSGND